MTSAGIDIRLRTTFTIFLPWQKTNRWQAWLNAAGKLCFIVLERLPGRIAAFRQYLLGIEGCLLRRPAS